MGQKLVIQNFTPFQNENQDPTIPTNAIYYHWSAYTESAIEEIKQLKRKVENYYDQFYNSTTNKLDFFNLACLNAISGISPQHEKSVKYIENLLEEPYDTTKVNRTDGMIGFTEDDINHIQCWSEGTVDIDWVLMKMEDLILKRALSIFGHYSTQIHPMITKNGMANQKLKLKKSKISNVMSIFNKSHYLKLKPF